MMTNTEQLAIPETPSWGSPVTNSKCSLSVYWKVLQNFDGKENVIFTFWSDYVSPTLRI